ncbi:unnamed protein product [Rhodiola kirilowii]
MTLHGVPLGDYFSLHLKYQIEDVPLKSQGQNVHVFFGISWLKSTRHQKKITKNIVVNLQERLKGMFVNLEEGVRNGEREVYEQQRIRQCVVTSVFLYHPGCPLRLGASCNI